MGCLAYLGYMQLEPKNNSSFTPLKKAELITFISISTLTVIISWFSFFSIWGFIGLLLSFIIIAGSVLTIYINSTKFGYQNFLNYNNALIAHIGVGIMILGITCSSVFKSEYSLSILKNEEIKFDKYSVELIDIKILERDNFQELNHLNLSFQKLLLHLFHYLPKDNHVN